MKSRFLISALVVAVLILSGNVFAGPKGPVEFKVSPDNPAAAPQADSDGITMPPEAMENPPPGTLAKKKTGQTAETFSDEDTDAKPGSGVNLTDAGVSIINLAAMTKDGGVSLSPDASVAAIQTAAPVQKPPTPFIALEVPRETVVDIQKHWEKRKAALDNRDYKTAGDHLDAIAVIRLDNGYKNLFSISTALVQESKAAIIARDRDGALRLAEAASRLSPDLPSAQLQKMLAAFARNKTDLAPISGFMFDTVESIINDPPSLILAAANLILILGAGFALALFAFILSMLIRNAPLLFHDFGHLFPKNAHWLPVSIIGSLILLVPAALGAGPLLLALFWATAAWQYSERREKVLLFIAAALISIVPFGIPYAASALDQGNGRAMTLYQALRDGEAKNAPSDLIAMAATSKDPAEILAAGLMKKRAGKFDEAEKFYLKASGLDPNNPAPVINIGNLYLLRDRYQDAIETYNKALVLDPASATAKINMSQVFFRQGEVEKGKAERESADKLNPEIGLMLSMDSPSINQVVVDAEPSNSDLLRRLAMDATPRRQLIINFLEGWLTGGFGAHDAPYLFAVFAVILVLLERLKRILRPSSFCQKCGRPACIRCVPSMNTGPLCAQCHTLYQTKDIVDPEIKTAMEIDAARHSRLVWNFKKVVSVLIPGSGFLMSGAPALALVSMILVFPSIVFLVTSGGPVPWRFIEMRGVVWSLGLLFALISAIFYIKSISAAFKR